MKKNLILLICLLAFIPTAYAKDTITKEEFIENSKEYLCYVSANQCTVTDNAVEWLYASNGENNTIKFTFESDHIVVIYKNNTYQFDYNLDNNPTVTFNYLITKGMTYQDYLDGQEVVQYMQILYSPIVKAYRVDFDDSSLYFGEQLLNFALSSLRNQLNDDSNNERYVIIDDSDESSEIEVEGPDNVIYTSNFGDKAIEYFISSNPINPISFDDSEGINSFVETISYNQENEEKLNVTTTLSISKSADYASLNGYADKKVTEMMGKEVTRENADYVVDISVGQKLVFKSSKKIIEKMSLGYGLTKDNNDQTDTSEMGNEIYTAIAEGTVIFKIVYQDETEDFIYVEINKKSYDVNTIELNLNNKKEPNSKIDTETKTNEETKEQKKENPKTGIEIPFISGIVLLTASIIIIKISKKKVLI